MYTNIISGLLLSLAFMNRIVYIPFVILIAVIKPKLLSGLIAGIVLMSILINPIPYFENNVKMFHMPKYILDYSLLLVLPVMLFLNDKNIITKIKNKLCKHTILKKHKGYIYENKNYYYSFICLNCYKVIKKKINIFD